MQRYIARRVLHSLLAILAMSLIVFSLARITGNPLDVMLPLEAGPEDYERVSKHWGLDQPLADGIHADETDDALTLVDDDPQLDR